MQRQKLAEWGEVLSTATQNISTKEPVYLGQLKSL